jgi:hypothetical protein
MREILILLRGARLIAKGVYGGKIVRHFLLRDGRILETVSKH